MRPFGSNSCWLRGSVVDNMSARRWTAVAQQLDALEAPVCMAAVAPAGPSVTALFVRHACLGSPPSTPLPLLFAKG